MKNVCMVAIDSSQGSQRALEHAIARAKVSGAELVLVHVIDWSPYSFHTAEELAARQQRREDEVSRAQETILKPLEPVVEKEGIKATLMVRHGRGAETLSEIAKELEAAQVIIGRAGEGSLKTRMFGSTSSKLVQISDVPVLVVP